MAMLKVTGSTSSSISVSKAPIGVVIIYGRGADLGNFGVFAENLRKDLVGKYGKNIEVKNIERKADFFAYLSTTKFAFQVKELHIFCHSFGTGLALGYHDPIIAAKRNDFARTRLDWYYQNSKYDQLYDDIIKLEEGILFIDDLINATTKKRVIQALFSPSNAFVKLWGCNSAVSGWEYDSNDVYWGALNYKRNPKPSIAQTVATFCNVVCYGATSGSHVEVLDNGGWITSEAYGKKYAKKASGTLMHRLQPDKGGYVAYNP